MKHLELRATANALHAENRTVKGMAIVFDSPADMGDFIEVVKPKALRNKAQSMQAVRALYNHNADQILGSLAQGTLRLEESNTGLGFELDLPNTTYGNDVLELIKRGDVAGASFGFTVERDVWIDGEKPTRELHDIVLHEITLTHSPAYPATSVSLRALRPADAQTARLKRWLETC